MDNGVSWPQVFTPDRGCDRVIQDFHAFPFNKTFVIGSDGAMLAIDPKDEDIEREVERALSRL